jgi:preprotein translocase subunit SecD
MRILVLLGVLLLAGCQRLMAPPVDGPGAMLVLEIDRDAFRIQQVRALSTNVREELRRQPMIILEPVGGRKVVGNHVVITPNDPANLAAAKERLGAIGIDVKDGEPGRSLEVGVSEERINAELEYARGKSVEAVERRLEQAGFSRVLFEGTSGPIVVRVPGLTDPKELASLARLLTASGDLSLNLVDEEAVADDYQIGVEKNGRIALVDEGWGQPLVIMTDPIVTAADVAGASQSYDTSNHPSISFQLNDAGTARFARATEANVGRRFAIVFGGHIVSAPNIRSPITKGTGTIEGNFTVEKAQDMATVMRSKPLPAPLRVLRTQIYQSAPKLQTPPKQ